MPGKSLTYVRLLPMKSTCSPGPVGALGTIDRCGRHPMIHSIATGSDRFRKLMGRDYTCAHVPRSRDVTSGTAPLFSSGAACRAEPSTAATPGGRLVPVPRG